MFDNPEIQLLSGSVAHLKNPGIPAEWDQHYTRRKRAAQAIQDLHYLGAEVFSRAI